MLMHEKEVCWQGARFLPRCPSSAAAEFEGLILGLEAANSMPSFEKLRIEGDCRVVLSQISGRARSRKLSKLHGRAREVLTTLSLLQCPSFHSIPRDTNGHADSLSRAAIDAAQALHGAIVLSCEATGQHRMAIDHLERAASEGVPFADEVYAELLEICAAAADWPAVLCAYQAARGAPTQRANALAMHALEELGDVSSKTGNLARRQYRELLRLRRAGDQTRVSAQRPQTRTLCRDLWCATSDDERSAAATTWRTLLVSTAGGIDALCGKAPQELSALMELTDGLSRRGGLGFFAVDAHSLTALPSSA